jgi:hypothetical protein
MKRVSIAQTDPMRNRRDTAPVFERGVIQTRWLITTMNACRFVVGGFRRILTRWEKRADTYLAMLHLACGLGTWRSADWERCQPSRRP